MDTQNAADVVGAPITFQGREYVLHSMPDYGQMERALKQQVIKNTQEGLRLIGANEDRIEARVVAVAQRLVTLGDMQAFVNTSTGAELAIVLSLKKSGVTDAAEAKAIISKIPSWEAIKLARKVSTVEAMFREQLAEAKAEQEAERLARQRASASSTGESDAQLGA